MLTSQVLWLELPTNPMLLVPPLPLIAKIVDSLNPRPVIVIDTTFLSSFYFTPLAHPERLGDIVLSSLSKYSGGHSDLILGSLTVSSRVKDRTLRGLRFLQNAMGGVPSPRDCHLMIRSLKTLSVRALRHGLNALQLADWLRQNKHVSKVRYPGLSSDGAFRMVEPLLSDNARRELEFLGWEFPFQKGASSSGSGLARARSLGIPFGGVVTFRFKNPDHVEKFTTSLRLILLAESLGGVESLIEVPDAMTHSVGASAMGCAHSGSNFLPRPKPL